MRPIRPWLAAVVSLTLAACGGGTDSAGGADASGAGAGAPAVTEPGVAATGDVIEVKMITDEQGNRFEPAEFEAEQGDVIRLVLVSGVHNLHFLPDSNPGATGLPPASDLLQLPGQTLDILITMPEGEYYFQCDPHAALGMVGKLEVDD